ncbi:hypothetical protein PENANT_c004G01384, partial [Penicillium antarcticum]
MPPIRSQSSQKRTEQEVTTLRRRISGIKSREETRANNHKLTSLEEETLEKWILSLDERGAGPGRIIEKWVYRYVQRYPNLRTRFSRSYDYRRAQCEDTKLILTWFNFVQNTVAEYGILDDDIYNFDDDIYNFDETSFALGLITTAK